jgi:hypothetical protein
LIGDSFPVARILALTLVLSLIGAVAPARATPNTALTLISNGAAGDPFAGLSSTSILLDTNNGNVNVADGSGNYIYSSTLPSLVVTQPDGSLVRVFDFSTFTVPYGVAINLSGSMAAAIVASGNITINGTLNAGAFKLGNSVGVGAGGFAGGLGVTSSNGLQGSGPNGSGGFGGTGLSAFVQGPCCGYNTSSGGGGGGSGSAGQAGVAGTLFVGGTNGAGGAGGNAAFNSGLLQGGGGGGAGSGGANCCYQITGNNGAPGGGAMILETPGDISIGTAGIVAANGQNGIQDCSGGGAGGGGGGGELWFDAGNSFLNQGTIEAIGGAPAVGGCTSGPGSIPGSSGAGAGGVVVIDPLSIVNDGIINLSDGNGLGTFGGLIDSFGQTITGDGVITGQGPDQIPEPATVALLLYGLGTLGIIRRRGRAGPAP